MDPTDLERFRATGNSQLPPPTVQRPPRHKAGEWFLKGPIPGPWLERAAALPGKTLHVGLALWYAAGLKNRRTVTLSHKVLARFGVGRDAGRRALDRMAKAGLVSVDRGPGRCPRVTINEAPKGDSPGKFGTCSGAN